MSNLSFYKNKNFVFSTNRRVHDAKNNVIKFIKTIMVLNKSGKTEEKNLVYRIDASPYTLTEIRNIVDAKKPTTITIKRKVLVHA